MNRTTILLDEDSRRAARELASRFDCSMSEAIRRAIVGYREHVAGVPLDERERRVEVLRELFDLFEGHDADDELQRLKEEDEGF